MKQVPALHKMRSLVSENGRVAQFFLLFKGGQHACFSIPFHKMGLFLTAVKNVVRVARDRLIRTPAVMEAETEAGLSDPVVASAVAVANDAETGEVLLWVETVDSGAFSFQLSSDAAKTLCDELLERARAPEPANEKKNSVLKYG